MAETTLPPRPAEKPDRPHFSSGPCAKRPGWTPAILPDTVLGRAHRSAVCQARLKAVLDELHALLELPGDYRLAIVPASDTGAVELALWAMLGARGVDLFGWENFGYAWDIDIREHLRIADYRPFLAAYGDLPDLSQADFDRDVVFCWNGTSSGVRLPNGDFIPDDRAGLTICDATSAVLAMEIPWRKLDVITFSWQKVLGGEAGHGIVVLSPRAIERLETHTPPWPLPKLFRLTKKGRIDDSLFAGATINTPSMLCVEDVLDAINWAREAGGQAALIARAAANLKAVERWVEQRAWVEFLANDPATRSPSSICLRIEADWFRALPEADRKRAEKRFVNLLEDEGAAYDIGAYRDAPAGLRVWGGATVETADIERLLPWLDWAEAVLAGEYAAMAG